MPIYQIGSPGKSGKLKTAFNFETAQAERTGEMCVRFGIEQNVTELTMVRRNENPKPHILNGVADSAQKNWNTAMSQMKGSMDRQTFSTLLGNADLLACEDGVYTIGMSNGFTRDWAEQRLSGTLEKILSGIKGAGNVEVMVVFKDDGKEDIAMNREYSKDGEGSVKSGETAVMTSGRNAVIVQKNLPQVQGVIVTAEGAADEKVRDSIKNAVAAALPVAYHRIEVLEQEYTG